MDSLTRLKDDVQCFLCNDTFIEPKILSCFHTFCKLCIKRHAELIEEVNIFKCPKCKSETRLPDLNSVEGLKSSLLHSRMLKVLEFVESEKVCSVSGSHPPASWHCFDCDRSLCDECEKNHSLFIKNHSLASLAETKEDDIKMMLSRENNCQQHVDKLVEWFCKHCDKVLCIECLKHGHEGHVISTLSNYAAVKKAHLSEKLEQLNQHEQDMETKFKAMEIMNNQFKESCEKAKLEVKQTLEKILETLRKKAKELTNQIDDEIMNTEKMNVKGQYLLDQQRGIISYLSKLLEKGIASEVILDGKEFEGKLDKQVGILQVHERYYSGITLVTNQELLKQANLGLGSLGKLKDTQQTAIGSAIACFAAEGVQASVAVDSKVETTKKINLGSTATSALGTPSTTTGFGWPWECEICLVNHEATATSCVACSSPKLVTFYDPFKKFASPSGSWGCESVSTMSDEDKNTTTKSLLDKYKPAEGSWECAACMVNNKATATSCVACSASKPSKTGRALPSNDLLKKFAPPAGSWSCETCLLSNKSADDKCVACQMPKPFSLKSSSTSLVSQSDDLRKKFAPAEDSWECSSCMTNNKGSDSKCVACQMPKPSLSKSAGINVVQSDDLRKKFAPAEDSWECSSCMTNNKGSDSKCVACQTPKLSFSKSAGIKVSACKSPKPGSSPSGGFFMSTSDDLMKKFAPSSDSWECSSCMLNNKGSDNKCAACETPKPGAESSSSTSSSKFTFGAGTSSLASKFAPASGSWTCDTCMIVNKSDALKCLACETPKPGSSSSGGFTLATGNAATKGSFTFGAASTGSNGKTTFQFGTSSKSDSSSSLAPVTFGSNAPTTTTKPFTFGGSSEAKKSESS